MDYKSKQWLGTFASVERELYNWRIHAEQHRREIQEYLNSIKTEMTTLTELSPIEKQELYFSIDAIEKELRQQISLPEEMHPPLNIGNQRTAEAVG